MTRTIGLQEILQALSLRFDHQSAGNVLRQALSHAGMDWREEYSPEEVSRIAWALSELEVRSQGAMAALLGLATRGASRGDSEADDAEFEADDGECPDDGLSAREDIAALLPQIVQAAVDSVRHRRREQSAREAEAEEEPPSIMH